MTAPVILLEATPRQASDGANVTVRLAGGGAALPYRYSSQDWRAGLVQVPTFVASIDFGEDASGAGEFGAGGLPQAAQLEWAPASMDLLAEISGHYWIDAPVTVRIGPEGTLPPVEITGKVQSANVQGGRLSIILSDPAADLKKPLPAGRYAGTGDLEGPAEWAGRIKRRIWGRVWNIALEPLDEANNIYCLADPLRPIHAIDAVRDKGAAASSLSTLAWQGSASATLAALRAASPPAGGGVVCPSLAAVKWWTEPFGTLCADARGEVGSGYVETTAQIVQRIVAAGANLPFASGTITAAASARPAPVGWVVQDEHVTQAAMIEELLGNSSLLWLLSSTGEIVLRPWSWGSPVASATSLDVKRVKTLRPVSTRRIGYRRNETPMARGDLAGSVLEQLANVPLGTNQVANPFFRDGLSQHQLSSNGVAGNGTLTFSGGKAVLASAAPSASGAFAAMSPSDGSSVLVGLHLFRVYPGQRVAALLKGIVSRADAYATAKFVFRDATLASDLPGTIDGIAFPGHESRLTNSVSEAAVYADVPAGAVWLLLQVIGRSTTTAAVSASIEAYSLAYIDPAQSVPPAWSEGPTGEYRATYGADWYLNVSSIPYDTITNNDDSTALGFNGSFEQWTGTYPSGWNNWGAPVISKETSIVRLGNNSVRFVGASGNTGIQRLVSFISNPMPTGTFLAGTFDVRLESVTSGAPTCLVRLFTDAALTTYRDTRTSPPSTIAGEWQTVNWVARVNPGEQIYAVHVYMMASWSSASRPYTGIVYYDRFQFAVFNGSLDNTTITINADGSLDGAGGGQVTINGLGYTGDLAATRNNPRGNYNNGTAYAPGDSVVWQVSDGGDGNTYQRVGTGTTTGVNPSFGSWLLYAIRGATGPGGAAGAAGNSVAVVDLYKRGATSPSLPSGTFTYTFATATLSGGTLNGWTQVVPAADGNPLWRISAAAVSNTATDSIPAAEFSTPIIDTGAGVNQAVVNLWKRGATSPSAPTGTFTYTFATGVLSGGTLNGWTQAPPASDGTPLWHKQATALSTSATDSIPAAEFSTAAKFVEDGAPGDDGAPGYSYAELTVFKQAASPPSTPSGGSYNFGTKVVTPPSGWVADPSSFSGTDPVWASKTTASIQGATGSAALSGWTAPGRVFASGADGQAIDIVYKRGTSTPATPSPSAGVPSTWYATPDAVPAGSGQVYASVGERPYIGANYSWQAAKQLEGSPGAPGSDGISGNLYPSNVVINVQTSGAPKAGELARIAGEFHLIRGANRLTSGVTYSVVSNGGLTGLAIDSAGDFGGVTGASLPAIATLRATYASVNYDLELMVTKVKDGSSATRGEAAITALTSSGSYTNAAFFDVTLAPGASFDLSAHASYAASAGTYQPRARLTFQNLTDSGSQSEISGSVVDGGLAAVAEPDVFSTSATYTNPHASSKNFRFAVQVYRLSGGGNATSVSGLLTGETA